jgi:uncharacterized protein YecT (DUF1311 family)
MGDSIAGSPPPRHHLPAALCPCPAVGVALVLLLSARAASAAGVRDIDFDAYLRAQVADECAGVQQPAGIVSLEFADLDRDGVEEAILVAWTCMTGTAGPDIHTVVKAARDGKLLELPIEEGEQGRGALAGNRNYSLHARGGELVREYTDGSGRKHPLTEFLRWDGSAFRVVRVERAPTYRASFDCTKAASDAEITVCGEEELAALDRELASAFAAARSRATGEKQKTLVAAQRAWLEDRDRQCIYKFIPECLREIYRKRLAELAPAGR